MNILRRIVPMMMVSALAAACAADEVATDRQATATALVQLIVSTATADAQDAVDPQDQLATAEAAATEAAQQQQEAIEAAGAQTAAAATAGAPPPTVAVTPTAEATATPLAIPTSPPSAEELAVQNELSTLGIDPSVGVLAWLHPPARLEVAGFQQFTATISFPDTVVRDFVMAADVTWNTEFGDAGCGFALRASALDAESSLYVAMLLRRDGGHAIFQSRENGVFLDSDQLDVRPVDLDPEFDALNDATNRFVVMAQGNTFSLFSNGTPIGQFTPQTEFNQGGVAFLTLSDSGVTTCQFDNGWLWLLD
jgi:hypothetical protein